MIHVRGRGLIPIERVGGELSTGMEVLTHAGWRRANAWREVGTRETILIRTIAGYELRTTKDHLIATVARQKARGRHGELRADAWCRAEELRPGDVVGLGPEDDGAVHDHTVAVPPWDTTVSSKGRASALPAASFPDVWSYDLGVVLGYALGDGYFPKDGALAIEVGASKKPDLVKLDAIISSWTGHPGHFYEYTREPTELVPTWRSSIRAAWTDHRLANYLRGFGLAYGVKSHMRRLPAGFWQAPRAAMLGLLSGLVSSDGAVSLRRDGTGYVRIATTSLGFALDVQLLLSALGVRVTRTFTNRPPYRTLYELLIRSRAGLDLVRAATLLSDAKRAAIECAARSPHTRHRDTRVAEIIDDRMLVPVYDISVDDVHEFVANGIRVHNCRAYAQAKGSHTCRWAIAPDGQQGCRACWIHPHEVVNYTLH